MQKALDFTTQRCSGNDTHSGFSSESTSCENTCTEKFVIRFHNLVNCFVWHIKIPPKKMCFNFTDKHADIVFETSDNLSMCLFS